MARTHTDALAWVRHGTDLLLTHVRRLDEAGFGAPSDLPGWTRKHLVAHVAANADALGNLAHWARTGERTPMYASPEQRNADIEAGATRDAAALGAWLAESAAALADRLAALSDRQWQTEVVTAQGRSVPATEIPWLRAREVCVHATDLGTGASYDDLPDAFLQALCDDVVARRNAAPAVAVVLETDGLRWELAGAAAPTRVVGSLPEIAAYLTGRRHRLATTDDAPAPVLPAWL